MYPALFFHLFPCILSYAPIFFCCQIPDSSRKLTRHRFTKDYQLRSRSHTNRNSHRQYRFFHSLLEVQFKLADDYGYLLIHCIKWASVCASHFWRYRQFWLSFWSKFTENDALNSEPHARPFAHLLVPPYSLAPFKSNDYSPTGKHRDPKAGDFRAVCASASRM